MRWLRRLFGTFEGESSIPAVDEFVARHEAQERATEAAASVDGKHYTDYVERVKALKREGHLDEATTLLLRLVAATEAEAAVAGLGVAPWYYEQLAIVYRKQGKSSEELTILERYAKQPKAPGAKPEKLEMRLQALKSRGPEA